MRVTALALCAMLIPGLAEAQRNPTFEIGTHAGATLLRSAGETITHAGIPGGGVWSLPGVYMAFFPMERVTIEPELAANFMSDEEDETFTRIGFAGSIGYYTQGFDRNSLFVAPGFAYQLVDVEGDNESDFAAGARLGYRVLVRDVIAMRFEAGYRRWFDDKVDEYTLRMGFGAAIGRDRPRTAGR